MRKLASIQKIVNIEPIENADKIEKLTILGWHVVASKEEKHKIGDLVCYIEVDSKVPAIPMFEFLKERKYVVKTIKLRKQISQGLVIPLKAIKENFPKINVDKLKEGDDITDLLGITKHDPEGEKERKLLEQEMAKNKNPIHKFFMKYKWYRKLYNKIFGTKKGGFPSWFSKSDETRVQAIPDIFYEIVNSKNPIHFDITEKLDGQSASYFLTKEKVFGLFNKYDFGVCSRNLRLKTPTNSSYWSLANKYNIEYILKDILKKHRAHNIVIQGEACGEGIQKNKYKIEGYDLFVFNLIIDRTKI